MVGKHVQNGAIIVIKYDSSRDIVIFQPQTPLVYYNIESLTIHSRCSLIEFGPSHANMLLMKDYLYKTEP